MALVLHRIEGEGVPCFPVLSRNLRRTAERELFEAYHVIERMDFSDRDWSVGLDSHDIGAGLIKSLLRSYKVHFGSNGKSGGRSAVHGVQVYR